MNIKTKEKGVAAGFDNVIPAIAAQVAGILGGLLAEKITKIKTSLYDVPKQ